MREWLINNSLSLLLLVGGAFGAGYLAKYRLDELDARQLRIEARQEKAREEALDKETFREFKDSLNRRLDRLERKVDNGNSK